MNNPFDSIPNNKLIRLRNYFEASKPTKEDLLKEGNLYYRGVSNTYSKLINQINMSFETKKKSNIKNIRRIQN